MKWGRDGVSLCDIGECSTLPCSFSLHLVSHSALCLCFNCKCSIIFSHKHKIFSSFSITNGFAVERRGVESEWGSSHWIRYNREHMYLWSPISNDDIMLYYAKFLISSNWWWRYVCDYVCCCCFLIHCQFPFIGLYVLMFCCRLILVLGRFTQIFVKWKGHSRMK